MPFTIHIFYLLAAPKAGEGKIELKNVKKKITFTWNAPTHTATMDGAMLVHVARVLCVYEVNVVT